MQTPPSRAYPNVPDHIYLKSMKQFAVSLNIYVPGIYQNALFWAYFGLNTSKSKISANYTFISLVLKQCNFI